MRHLIYIIYLAFVNLVGAAEREQISPSERFTISPACNKYGHLADMFTDALTLVKTGIQAIDTMFLTGHKNHRKSSARLVHAAHLIWGTSSATTWKENGFTQFDIATLNEVKGNYQIFIYFIHALTVRK